VEREFRVPEDCKGHALLTIETVEVITDITNYKAVGVDDIQKEFLKTHWVRKALRKWLKFCKTMYDESVWPYDFGRVIQLQKRSNTENVKITES
jgi:hypothetical protein